MDRVKNNIMRRAYYAFFLRMLKHPIVTHGAVLSFSFVLLTRVVSVPDVWRNMLEVRVGDVFSFFLGAILNTQSVTLIILGVMAVTGLSLLWRLINEQEPLLEVDEGGFALR